MIEAPPIDLAAVLRKSNYYRLALAAVMQGGVLFRDAGFWNSEISFLRNELQGPRNTAKPSDTGFIFWTLLIDASLIYPAANLRNANYYWLALRGRSRWDYAGIGLYRFRVSECLFYID